MKTQLARFAAACICGGFFASTTGSSASVDSTQRAAEGARVATLGPKVPPTDIHAPRANAARQCINGASRPAFSRCQTNRGLPKRASGGATRFSRPSSARRTGVIIGTNDGAGWGTTAAQAILAGHISWNRVEIGSESNSLAASLSDGFRTLAIVGNNFPDETPISSLEPEAWGSALVSELESNPGIAIAEAGNEMYYKGGVANPAQYGRMYLAAVHDMKSAGLRTRLLFNMEGDVPTDSWSSPSGWSRDSTGGGWLRDAVDASPGLSAAIRENGVSAHPYGGLEENYDDSGGVRAVAAQESLERSVLGAVPPTYITEYGFDLGRCGWANGACSQAEQAAKLSAAYKAFLADPHVAGIWWYESHDDRTGQWGYMNNDGSMRLAFQALSAIAVGQGQ
jgi:hypothetical protein